jgi:hypothetical protein
VKEKMMNDVDEACYRFVNRIPKGVTLPLTASGSVPLPTNVQYDFLLGNRREELKWTGEKWEFVESWYEPFVQWFGDAELTLRNAIPAFSAERGGITYRPPPLLESTWIRPTRRSIIAERKRKARDHRLHWFRDWKKARAQKRYDAWCDEFDDWDDDE